MNASSGTSLELTSVTRRYGGVAVVDNLSLKVEKGEFITLLGSSGSGKTTTLMMIAGFVEPSAGQLSIGGEVVTRLPPSKRNLGVVFQNYSLFPHLSVAANIGFPLEMRGIGRAEREERVRNALALVKLPDKADAFPRQLSGGQQQRIALARALVFNPRALLMDEPLGALDKNLREHMQTEIKRIQGEIGATVIYVTHDQEEALTMSDRIAVMADGRIAQLGSPSDLYERPANHWVASFIGQSNFLAGKAADGGVLLDVGSIATSQRGRLNLGAPVTLVLRPEKLSVTPGEAKPAQDSLTGMVSEIVYLGRSTRLGVVLRTGEVIHAEIQNRYDAPRWEKSRPVTVSWNPQDAWILPDAGASA
jgi:putative spermidine/putrescine transport system ATP-binding protein